MRIIIALFLFIPTFATASALTELGQKLEQTIYRCPERIWPGLDWKKYGIGLLSPSTGDSLLIKNGTISKIDQRTVLAFRSTYDFIGTGEDKSVYINIDELEESFQLTVHEAFHHFAQDNFPYNVEGREDHYPANPEPRIARHHLGRALADAASGKPGAIAEAAAWYNLYAKSNEPVGGDEVEGQAEYVESVASAVLELGCSADEEAIVSNVRQRLEGKFGYMDKSGEMYVIGGLAYLHARPNLERILSRLDGKSSILALVLEGVTPAENIAKDPIIVQKIMIETNTFNQEASAMIRQFETAFEKREPMTFVSTSSLLGSYSYQGGFIYEGMNFMKNLSVYTSSGSISGNALFVEACGEPGGFLLNSPAPTSSSARQDAYRGTPIICL